MAIREARRPDLPAVVRLWREMWDLHAATDERYAAAPAADKVMADFLGEHYEGDRSRILVAEEEGRVVGYALGMILENPPITLQPRFGYLSDLAVTASARRRGIGTELLARMHDWFRSQGARSAEVQVSTRNEAGRAFWRKHRYGDFLERLHCRL